MKREVVGGGAMEQGKKGRLTYVESYVERDASAKCFAFARAFKHSRCIWNKAHVSPSFSGWRKFSYVSPGL